MDKEACPACQSENTQTVEIEGETWWRCDHQGCEGRVSGAKHHWRPGQGAAVKSAAAKPADETST